MGWTGSLRIGALALAMTVVAVGCSSGQAAGDTTTTELVVSTVPSTPNTTHPETTTTVPMSTSTVAGPTEREFGFVEPFRVTAPAEWTRAAESSQQVMYLEAGGNLVAFAVSDYESVDEWIEALITNPRLTVTEPVPVEVSGAPGYSVDLRLSPEATTAGCFVDARCVTIISGNPGWRIFDSFPNRAWVVDVNGRPVFIAAEASEGSFDSFAARVQEALDTLTWTGE